VTTITAHPNQLLALPPIIQIQPNDIGNINLIGIKKILPSSFTGILSKSNNEQFKESTIIQNEVATFSLRNLSLQLNLSDSFYNCTEQFNITITISINDTTFVASYRVIINGKFLE